MIAWFLLLAAAIICTAAVFLFFGYYWSEYRRVVKAPKRTHWLEEDK